MSRTHQFVVSFPPTLPAAAAAGDAAPGDRQWLHAGALVTAFTLIGIGFSILTASTMYEHTFTFRVSMAYVPLAALAILFLGFGRFPTAAGIFFGYLPIAQASHGHDWVLGDIDAALTFEMILAVPFLIVALFGSRDASPGGVRPAPTSVKFLMLAFLFVAALSALLSDAVSIAAATLLARFILPIAVAAATFRRLRNIQDYRALWFGLVVSLVAISVFQFRRGVLGETEFGSSYSQRFLGATQSFGLPMLYVAGGALWLGLARGRKGLTLAGVLWFMLVGGFVLQLWLAATRGPLITLGLLVLWWAPGFLRQLHRPGTIVLTLLGGVSILYLFKFSLTETSLDVSMILDRFQDLWAGGFTHHNRAAVWGMALDCWRTSPILGIGPNVWVTHNTGYESPHSLVFGLLCDTGLVGLVVFAALVGAVLVCTRHAVRWINDPVDRAFFLGCRAGWVIMLITHVTNLPFSSGQPTNNIHAYMVFMFPMLLMTVWSRYQTAVPMPPPREAAGGMWLRGTSAARVDPRLGQAPGRPIPAGPVAASAPPTGGG